MILKFNVKEQTISLVNTKSVPRIGSKDYLVLQFSFSSDWENLNKLAYLQNGDVSQPIDIVDNLVEVPEWFTEQNSFNVTLFGTDGTTEVPTNVVSVQLEKSNDLWVKDAPEPQPSWLVSVLDAAELVKEATVHGPTIGSNGNWYTWDFESKQYIDTGVGASGGSGTTDHTQLTNRDAENQHPMSAITGLVGALGGKMNSNDPVGTGSFSMGRKGGTVIGIDSHAEGNRTTASGRYSHAEGAGTTAYGVASHAEGDSTTASGNISHAEGTGTKASGNYSHVQGKHNIEDSSNLYAHIVGNGTRTTARSNAHTLDWSGNAWYAGDVFVGSASGTNKDDGSKKLSTEEYVNSEIADCIKAPATAEVGQTIVVKAVDENGKPTEWEAADMASGGGGEPEYDYEKTVVLDEAVASYIIDTFDDGTPLALSSLEVISVTTNNTASTVTVNILTDLPNAASGGKLNVSTTGGYTGAGKWMYCWLEAKIKNGECRADFSCQVNVTRYINFYAGIAGSQEKLIPAITYSAGTTEIFPKKATKFTSVEISVVEGSMESGSMIRIRGVKA